MRHHVARAATAFVLAALPILITMPQAVAAPSAAVTNDQRMRMLALYQEEQEARHKLKGPWSRAVVALQTCMQAKQLTTRVEICGDAQKIIDACLAARDDWRARKQALLAEVERAQPGVGQEYTPGISSIRGVGRQPNPDELWNDSVKALRAMDIAPCPYTLPDAYLTPAQALELWAQEERGKAAIIARCDDLSRQVFRALDEEDADRASPLLDEFVAACSREFRTYEERARMARDRLVVLKAKLAAASPPPAPRKTGYAASLVQGSINQAELDARDPEGARRRKSEEAQRAEAERKAIEQRSDERVARIMSGVQTLIAGTLANPGAAVPGAVDVLKQSVAPEYSALIAGSGAGGYASPTGDVSAPLPGSGAGGSGDASTCASEIARQDAAAVNARAKEPADTVGKLRFIMTLTQARMRLLDQHCRGLPQYGEHAAMRKTFNDAMRTCQQISSNPAQCGPTN